METQFTTLLNCTIAEEQVIREMSERERLLLFVSELLAEEEGEEAPVHSAA